jgi:outer membrane protein assembly factor BamA
MTKPSLRGVNTRRLKSAFLFGSALLAADLAGAIGRGAHAQGRTPEVRAVVFQGANSLDHSLLRRSIRTTATRCRSPLFFVLCRAGLGWSLARMRLDTAEVRRDVERLSLLYEAWGYPDVVVRSELDARSANKVTLTFQIREGRPLVIRSIRVEGTEQIPGFRMPRRLPLSVGEPYALPRLESTEALLYAQLVSLGYPHARIDISGAVDEPARRADVVLQVQPQRHSVFGSTRIRAQLPIAESVVRRRLDYVPGDAFSIHGLEATERNLYRLPIVERAVATVRSGQAGDSIIDIDVAVTTRPRHGFSGETLLSSTDCLELRGYWQHRYFLGGPRVFALGIGSSNLLATQASGDFPCTSSGQGIYAEPNYGVEADLRQFLGRSGLLTVHGFAARESSPDVFVQEGFGGALSFARALTRGLDAMISIAPERNQLEAADLYFCGQYGVCTQSGINDLSGWSWLSPAEAVLTWRSSDAPTDVRKPNPAPGREWSSTVVPTQRWTARAGFAAAGSFSESDYEYQRGLLEVTSVRLLGSRVEVAARARAGWLETEEVVPPQVMLFSGGANTVRGVAQNLLGPMVLATRVRPANCDPCDPNTSVDPEQVTLRPTGGDRLLEGNLEARFWVSSRMQLAAFLDAGYLERSAFDNVAAASDTRITPGIGLRVISEVGPIRLDIGYDASGGRRYPLFLQENGELLRLGDVQYNPFRFGNPDRLEQTLRRLQLHLSIGQAF